MPCLTSGMIFIFQQQYSFFLGFLTAVLQNHARKHGVSVDSLKFDFKVIPGRDDSEEYLSDVKGLIDVREVAFKVCQVIDII